MIDQIDAGADDQRAEADEEQLEEIGEQSGASGVKLQAR